MAKWRVQKDPDGIFDWKAVTPDGKTLKIFYREKDN